MESVLQLMMQDLFTDEWYNYTNIEKLNLPPVIDRSGEESIFANDDSGLRRILQNHSNVNDS